MSEPRNSSSAPLQQKVALVTGASRGIGKAIAVALSRAGARVACVATSAERCAETVAAIAAEGGEASAHGVDVADTAAVAALVEEVARLHGSLDLLVNNAGVTRDQLLLRMSEEDFDRVIDVNLKGTWNFTKAATRLLMKRRGRIVNVASVVGITGNAGQANYAASKAGLHGFTQSLAKEYGRKGITANVVVPGFFDTDMTRETMPQAAKDYWQQYCPMPKGRMGTLAELAATVLFLATGGSFINGQVVPVTGGLDWTY
jgi:3-oxoacyl-[acyl-carrier protein] reductase